MGRSSFQHLDFCGGVICLTKLLHWLPHQRAAGRMGAFQAFFQAGWPSLQLTGCGKLEIKRHPFRRPSSSSSSSLRSSLLRPHFSRQAIVCRACFAQLLLTKPTCGFIPDFMLKLVNNHVRRISQEKPTYVQSTCRKRYYKVIRADKDTVGFIKS